MMFRKIAIIGLGLIGSSIGHAALRGKLAQQVVGYDANADVRARSLEEFGELVRHPGEEFAYVLEGAVYLHTSLYTPVRLNVGDSIYFDSGMAHAYLKADSGPCRVLSICSGPESQLIEAVRRENPEKPKSGRKRKKV